MTRLALTMGALAIALVVTAACGRSPEQTPSQESTAAAPVSGSPTQQLDITFKSEPEPPKMGDNACEVMVMAGSQPVTDADVSVQFFMAAMPAMKMPEMKNNVMLKHEANGRYVGKGQVMMGGKWDVTVMVTRAGKEVAIKKFPVSAQ